MNKETFWDNEYRYLTGQWFVPLPVHYWQLMTYCVAGGIIVEVETDIEFQLTGNAKVKGYCEGLLKGELIFKVGTIGRISVKPENIKKMRIISFDKKSLTLTKLDEAGAWLEVTLGFRNTNFWNEEEKTETPRKKEK